jgi:hypothetical protein
MARPISAGSYHVATEWAIWMVVGCGAVTGGSASLTGRVRVMVLVVAAHPALRRIPLVAAARDDRYFAKIVIAGQGGAYRHLQAVSAALLTGSGLEHRFPRRMPRTAAASSPVRHERAVVCEQRLIESVLPGVLEVLEDQPCTAYGGCINQRGNRLPANLFCRRRSDAGDREYSRRPGQRGQRR